MNICIVTHEFTTHTGQGRVNYEIARYLLDQGHRVFMVASEVAPELSCHPNAYVLLVKIPKWVQTAILRHQIFAVRSAALLRQHRIKFDVIHANGGITYHSSDVNACHFVHSSWINSRFHPIREKKGIEGLYQWLYTALNGKWEQRADRATKRVIAVSDFVKHSLIEDAHVPAETIEVIWNGVDIEEFRPRVRGEENLLRSSLGLPVSACISFFTGDIKSNRKNLDLVLHAMKRLPSQHHLVVAGSTVGSPYPAMARRMGLEDRVHFLGHRSDVSVLLRCADVFTFPSHYDPCPLVVLEALASGIPVITTRSVGNSALIESGKNGYILSGNYDLDGLVESLLDFGESEELRSQIGQEGRKTAEERSWQKMARNYEAIYQSVLRQEVSISREKNTLEDYPEIQLR
jgi:glycosyltransferase involved in cell wall biosynthesis